MNVTEQAYTKFNSEGKLLQIEYGLEAVYSSYQIVSAKFDQGIVNVSKKIPKQALCVETHTSIFKIADNIYMNITGLPADIDYVVNRARILAAQKQYELGVNMLTPQIFSRFLADKFTKFIQRSVKRSPAFAATIFGFDGEAPSLHYTDLSAVEYACKACCAGEDHSKMYKYLEKQYAGGDVDSVIHQVIATLLESIGKDAEANEIEVAVLTKNGLETLANEKIDKILQEIAEKH